MAKKALIFIAMLTLTVSCGYHFGGQSSFATKYDTVSVPYVDGDIDGRLTQAIVRELTTGSTVNYVRDEGELLLKVKLTDSRDENIGFRYDRDRSDNVLKSVVQAEGRTTIIAEITLEDSKIGKVILGPTPVTVSIDYDYDVGHSSSNLLSYSLGQLDTVDAAREAASPALYRDLAERIVDHLNHVW